MNISRWLTLSALVFVVMSGPACTQQAADDATLATDTALAATRKGAATVIDATRDATKDLAAAISHKTDEVVVATSETITDGWITTRVSARFVDEALLKGSDIDVDTEDRVVTLNGTVGSDAASARAAEIARGTEGVTRVVTELTVTP